MLTILSDRIWGDNCPSLIILASDIVLALLNNASSNVVFRILIGS